MRACHSLIMLLLQPAEQLQSTGLSRGSSPWAVGTSRRLSGRQGLLGGCGIRHGGSRCVYHAALGEAKWSFSVLRHSPDPSCTRRLDRLARRQRRGWAFGLNYSGSCRSQARERRNLLESAAEPGSRLRTSNVGVWSLDSWSIWLAARGVCRDIDGMNQSLGKRPTSAPLFLSTLGRVGR